MENIAKNIIMVGSVLLFIGALIYLQDKVHFAGKQFRQDIAYQALMHDK